MAKIRDFIKKKKLFSLLIFVGILGGILGSVFLFLLNEDMNSVMSNSINTYFSDIASGNINYMDNFIVSIINNLCMCFGVWLLGISVVGCLLVIVIFGLKCFMTSVSFIGIIKVYGYKGLLLSIVYIIPYIINMMVLFILSYYAISFSILIYKYFFRGADYNRKIIVKRYIKVLLCCIGCFIVTTIIDVFLIPRILLLF